MEVVSIKLTNGEEWIGRMATQLTESGTIQVKDVRKLQLVPNGKGGMGLALTPVLLGNVNADVFTLSKQHIVVSNPVDSDFEKQYIQEISGIQLA